MAAQILSAAIVAAILVSTSLQSYTGPTCNSKVESHHSGFEMKAEHPSGSVYKIKPQPTTTTTAAPGVKPNCIVPFQGNPDIYDWLQILEETGGEPGQVNATKQQVEKPAEYSDPCERPLYASEGEGEKLYSFKHTDFKKFFRNEDAFLRFAGTKLEFVDIRGFVVWTPPQEAEDPRIYQTEYRQDDTGLWLKVKQTNCTFTSQPALYCKGLPTCRCSEEGELRCKENRVISPNLMASLVG